MNIVNENNKPFKHLKVKLYLKGYMKVHFFTKKVFILFYFFSATVSLSSQSETDWTYTKECSGYSVKLKKLNDTLYAFWEYLEDQIITEGFVNNANQFKYNIEKGEGLAWDKILTGKLIVRDEEGKIKRISVYKDGSEEEKRSKHWFFNNDELFEYYSEIIGNYNYTDTWIQCYGGAPAIITTRKSGIVHTQYLKSGIKYAENFDINYWDIRSHELLYIAEEPRSKEVKRTIKQLAERKNFTNTYYDLTGNIMYRFTRNRDTLNEQWYTAKGEVWKKTKGKITGMLSEEGEFNEDMNNEPVVHGMGILLIETEVYDTLKHELLFKKSVKMLNRHIDHYEVYMVIDNVVYTCSVNYYKILRNEDFIDSVIEKNTYVKAYQNGKAIFPTWGYNLVSDDYDNEELSVSYPYCREYPEIILQQYHQRTKDQQQAANAVKIHLDTLRFEGCKWLEPGKNSHYLLKGRPWNAVKDFENCLYGIKDEKQHWVLAPTKYDNIIGISKRGGENIYFEGQVNGQYTEVMNTDLEVLFREEGNPFIEVHFNSYTQPDDSNACIFFKSVFKNHFIVRDALGKVRYRADSIADKQIQWIGESSYLMVRDSKQKYLLMINISTGEETKIPAGYGEVYVDNERLFLVAGHSLYKIFKNKIKAVINAESFSSYHSFRWFPVFNKDTLIMLYENYSEGIMTFSKMPVDNAGQWFNRVLNNLTSTHTYIEDKKDPYRTNYPLLPKYSYRGKWGIWGLARGVAIQNPVWDSISSKGLASKNHKWYLMFNEYRDTVCLGNYEVAYHPFYTNPSDYYNTPYYDFVSVKKSENNFDIYTLSGVKRNTQPVSKFGYLSKETDNSWYLGLGIYFENERFETINPNHEPQRKELSSGVLKCINDAKKYLVHNSRLIASGYDKIKQYTSFRLLNPEIKTWAPYYEATANNSTNYLNRAGKIMAGIPNGRYKSTIMNKNYGMDSNWKIYRYRCDTAGYFPDTFARIGVTENPDLYFVNTTQKYNWAEGFEKHEFLFSSKLNKFSPFPVTVISSQNQKTEQYYRLSSTNRFLYLMDKNFDIVVKPDSWEQILFLGDHILGVRKNSVYRIEQTLKSTLLGTGIVMCYNGLLYIRNRDYVTLYDKHLRLVAEGPDFLLSQREISALDTLKLNCMRGKLRILVSENVLVQNFKQDELSSFELASLSEKQKRLYRIIQFENVREHSAFKPINVSGFFPSDDQQYFITRFGSTKPKKYSSPKSVSEANKRIAFEVAPSEMLGKRVFKRIEDFYQSGKTTIEFCKGEIVALKNNDDYYFSLPKNKYQYFRLTDSGAFLFDLHDMIDSSKREVFMRLLSVYLKERLSVRGSGCVNDMKGYNFEYFNRNFKIEYDKLQFKVDDSNSNNIFSIPLNTITNMLSDEFAGFYK